jgi:hypothetical protein
MATLCKGLLILAAIPCAFAVAGCSSQVAQHDVRPQATSAAALAPQRDLQRIRKLRALLVPQSPPDCAYRGADDADTLDPELLALLKLDYESHCYQKAEVMMRRRLRQLQVSGLWEIQAIRHHQGLTR